MEITWVYIGDGQKAQCRWEALALPSPGCSLPPILQHRTWRLIIFHVPQRTRCHFSLSVDILATSLPFLHLCLSSVHFWYSCSLILPDLVIHEQGDLRMLFLALLHTQIFLKALKSRVVSTVSSSLAFCYLISANFCKNVTCFSDQASSHLPG